MPQASEVQTSFLGGEWSATAQGNFTDPKYKISMNVCQNGFPIEPGAWARRSGTQHAGYTRQGNPGRLIPFDFEELQPYDMEFTDGFLRFWANGLTLATTNDSATIVAISSANPAVVQLSAAVTWATGDTGFFSGLGTNNPLLQNRRFLLTKVDTTHFSIADEITGVNIDGSSLGAFVSGTLNHVQEVATPYTAGLWSSLRSIQTEDISFLLQSTVAPQALLVSTAPVGSNFATFNLSASFFEDGPYLDPIPNTIITTGGITGIFSLNVSFPAYSATLAYTKGEFVTAAPGSTGYKSLIDANLNNTPASSPTAWAVVSLGAAINNGQGFQSSDIGRLVRLFSEPNVWASGTTYGIGAVVSYNPSMLPGQTTYWQSLVASNLNNAPGADATHWELLAQGSTNTPALWSWGKITSLSSTGAIAGATGTNIGNMTQSGGLAAAFDGVLSKTKSQSAQVVAGPFLDTYVGKNYGGSPTTISQVVVYPSTDFGFCNWDTTGPIAFATVTLKLRAKNSAPTSASDGTLLGTTGLINNVNSVPVTILSTDTSTTYQYVWVEVINGIPFSETETTVAQAIFYNASAAPGTAVNIELLGPNLLYSATPINTWRLGVYSGTTGYPTCGTYSDGRLWLSGSVANRVDACYSNGINPMTGAVNFAPTDQFGNVTAANAIAYTFNAPDANPIFWMIPDLQGIIAGTQAGEWLIVAPTAGGISPLNIAARRVTKIRCANIEPRRTEHTLVFTQTHQRKVVEYFPDVFSGKFTAPNLSKEWKHLTISGVQELAYQQELIPIIWMRMGNGLLVGATYKRDTLMTSSGPTFCAAHKHPLGSGWTVQSICAGPSENGNLDALSMVTFDGTLYHVELMGDLFEEGNLLVNANFLDASVTPSSYVQNSTNVVLNGLWYLNGKTVTAFCGGLDCGDFAVSNGSMTVPLFGTDGQTNSLFTTNFVTGFGGAMPISVGFNFTSQGQCLTPQLPQDTGARQGPGFGKKKRFHGYQAQLVNTQGISFGTSFGTDAARQRAAQLKTVNGAGGSLIAANVLFNGMCKDTISDDPMGYTNKLGWQITRPFPATVVALGGFIETADE